MLILLGKIGPYMLRSVVVLSVVGFLGGAASLVRTWLAAPPGTPSVQELPKPQLLQTDTLEVSPEVVKALGLKTQQAKKAHSGAGLPPLAGTLALDASRLARLHARFSGEVVELGTIAGQPVRVGAKVEKGQLLAVIWSKELGEKKSELVDALSQLRLDKETLARLEEIYPMGAIPESRLREARRAVEQSFIAVAKAERTLRSWRLSPAEIAAVYAEAERLPKNAKKADMDSTWARVEVRAPQGGTILEQNVARGDIVDTSLDLFKIADLARLCVWAHVYEDDLPVLLQLPKPIHWTVQLRSDNAGKGFEGSIERVGDVVDPAQHTVLVMGYVDNSAGQLRSGQFITAHVGMPAREGEVAIPTSALIEDGAESVAFVQPDPARPQYTLRRLHVLRRTREVVYIKYQPGATQFTVAPGEWVLTAGALELRTVLEELQGLAPR